MTRASLTSLVGPAVVLGIALLGLHAAPARAADPPFRTLDSFDRIGVAFLSRQSVFVTTRQDATHDATDAVVQPTAQNAGPFPREIAWAPGAASFAMLAHASEDQLSMVDYPDVTRRDISAGLDPFRHSVVANTQRSLAALRWAGLPIPSSLHVLVSLTEAGVMRINPDGSGAQLVDSAGTAAGTALFADGHRIVGAGQVNTDSAGRPFNNLFVVDLRTGARTQLTHAPFNNDEEVALSPDETRVAYVEDAFGVPSQFRATPGFSGETKLRIVNIDGTNDHAISPDTTLYYSEPAWRPDGERIAFVGLRAPGANGFVGRPVLYSETPDGTDLVRHTVETGAEYPFPP